MNNKEESRRFLRSIAYYRRKRKEHKIDEALLKSPKGFIEVSSFVTGYDYVYPRFFLVWKPSQDLFYCIEGQSSIKEARLGNTCFKLFAA